MSKVDVVSVLTSSLTGFERVVEHLRYRGEFDVANDIAKKVLEVVSDFNDVTADWDIEKCLMEDNKSIRKSISEGPCAQSATPPRSIADHISNLHAGSWASVAAIQTNDKNELVDHRPSNGVKCATTTQDDDGVFVSPHEARVVWIKPKDTSINIDTKMVAKVITQGPLYSLAYSSKDHAVCLIFMDPNHAREFLMANKERERARGDCLLGPFYDVLPGQGYSNETELRRMFPPKSERRRLTFARSALFSSGLTEEKFKRDVFKMVGEEHVELIWLFNTGNATAVFSGVSVARKCREEFCQLARKNGPYYGIMVSYSHDPCERPLHLVTQIGNPSAKRAGLNQAANGPYRTTASTYNNIGSRLNGPPHAPAAVRIKDEDGWQTVVKRR